MRRAAAVVAALALCCCSKVPSAIERAQADVDFLQKNGGSDDDLCRAETKLADEYLAARDASGWQEAKRDAQLACTNADLGRRLRR